jgi:hypothetical protein
MDRVPGLEDFQGVSEVEKASVMEDYIAILARLHSLDIAPFVEAGIARADNPQESGTVGIRRYEELYRKAKKYPDPFLEFCLGWLRRNPPESSGRESAIVWDGGQFHHRDGRIEALLDLELGHLGDPMMDLASFRMRDTVIRYGDFNAFYARYAELTGEPVDLEAIKRYHFAFTLSNQLAFSAALREPAPESDYMTNLQWCCETNLFAVDALAEIHGLTLEEPELPQARSTRAAPAQDQLVALMRNINTGDPYVTYQLRMGFRLARYLRRTDEIGDAVIAADLDDLQGLLGYRPATWQEGDRALEAFVLADAGCNDIELIQLFNKRNRRAQMLLGPEGSAMTRRRWVQPFASQLKK